MSNTSKNISKVEVECEVADESESKGLLNKLREMGFNQNSITVSLPTVKIKGEFIGSFEEFRDNCEKLNKNWKVRQV